MSAAEAAEASSRGRVLVLVNPNSGAGKGPKVFRRTLEPALRRAALDFEVIETTGTGQAQVLVGTSARLANFDAIVIVSGDGLVYEVVNGLAARRDPTTDEIPSIPIGIVPIGSGNGLLSTVRYSLGQSLARKHFLASSIRALCSPDSAKGHAVNLLHVQTSTENAAAFMSLGWGLIADIDIESERWRSTLGSNRFALGALIRCLRVRTYRGRLFYRPCTSEMNECTKPEPTQVYGGAFKANEPEFLENAASRAADDIWTKRHLIPAPPLETDLTNSPDWVQVDSTSFVLVHTSSVSHIGRDAFYAPDTQPTDSRILLTWISADQRPCSSRLMMHLAAIEKGKHLEDAYLKRVYVSALRLESEEGQLVIDGERLNERNVQITVCRTTIRVVA